MICAFLLILILLMGRLTYLMVFQADHFGVLAQEIQERERSIKAERGRIFDRNGVELASNKPVCTISVIYNQVKEPDKVIEILVRELELDREYVEKRVRKKSSREKIKSNVEKEIADKIRTYDLDGVMVDEDYKRFYPYSSLASKVIGFTGSDNQGIIGLEVAYDKKLQGQNGVIYTLTTAKGIEIKNVAERRQEPVPGNDLYTSLDVNIQEYAWQAAKKVREEKNAKNVKVIVLNPQNGEIYAMVNEPEFDANNPYTLIEQENTDKLTDKEKNDLLNTMWRNACISDTYEPGSTFKIITATAALEEGKVSLKDSFYCPGFKLVEDRTIRCHKTIGHGAESFKEGIMNSCNPVFMEIGERTGVNGMYKWFKNLGLTEKTGIDVPGEANSIMHKKENVGAVELATMSFGQSFQITPLQLIRAVSAVVNGGNLITPHFGVKIENRDKTKIKNLEYKVKKDALSKETSETMKMLLEAVVAEGGGNKAYIEGYSIGGKTATSEKLPRSSNKYISSFIGFAPADNPKILAILLIDEPEGIYYGGTIAAPVVRGIFENILPYVGIEQQYISKENEKPQ
ncbi:MAG: peptidoglycan glycosyltransferase [Lachnospiraceae bacterium]|nr:peptidoglycan glycosyltransferase [Lachnospiraceae bacterium]